MTLPTQLLLAFIVVFPLLMQLYLSFTDWSPLDGKELGLGLRELERLRELRRGRDQRPTLGLRSCARFRDQAVCVPVELLLGLGLALLFIDEFLGKRMFYSILLMPMMVVPAVAGYMFFMLFQSGGPINANPFGAHFAGDRDRLAQSDEWLALVAVMIADIWQWTPLMFLILLAGLVGVPEDQMQAATLLGAGIVAALPHHRPAADRRVSSSRSRSARSRSSRSSTRSTS